MLFRQSQQALQLPQLRLQLDRDAKLRNGAGVVSTKIEQHAQIAPSVHVLRFQGDRLLQFGNREVRPLLLQVLL